MQYLDFEVEVGQGRGRQYSVAVLRSPAGEAREVMDFPYDELQLENRLQALQIAILRSGGIRDVKRRRVITPEEENVQELGRSLFEALFTGELRNRYDVSQERAAQKEMGLRIKLRFQSPELAALPWEFLYDPRRAEYVCLSLGTPVVRYLELPQPVQPLTVTPPLRVLAMIAAPEDLERLDVDREKLRVERALEDLQGEGLIELNWLEGQTWRDIQRALREGPWHIFHFIGHGGFDANADEGFIALSGPAGETDKLYATQLGRLLADHPSMRLAVLNSCEGARGGQVDIFSSSAAILVRRGLPAVLAMQYEITDRAAVEFAHAFYDSLAVGIPVDGAVSEARKAISLAADRTVEWGTPVLYMRAPEGQLFDIGEVSSRSERVATPPPDVRPTTGRTPVRFPPRLDFNLEALNALWAPLLTLTALWVLADGVRSVMTNALYQSIGWEVAAGLGAAVGGALAGLSLGAAVRLRIPTFPQKLMWLPAVGWGLAWLSLNVFGSDEALYWLASGSLGGLAIGVAERRAFPASSQYRLVFVTTVWAAAMLFIYLYLERIQGEVSVTLWGAFPTALAAASAGALTLWRVSHTTDRQRSV